MRPIAMIVVAIAALTLTVAGAAVDSGITVEPANPTVDDDVLITVTQGTPCITIPSQADLSHSIDGNTITVTIDVFQDVCLTAVDTLTVTESVGKLAPGAYDVEAIVDLSYCCGSKGEPPRVYTYHHTFEVTGPTASPAPSPEALPITGGAPVEQGRVPLAAAAALALGALCAAAIVSRAKASR